ncbi:tetratricopeptide repeat protein [Streptomyces sp. NPDC093094]|uniref:tetratricopeptide repeat protein n=1 Tax=Streptomyces sp. NPDC093094 TaxID=3366026 RepID=UPI0037F7DFD7
MTRSSRGEQREQPYAAQASAAGPAAPLDVRVGTAGALVDGVRIAAVPGEEIQRTVLKHLHTLARTCGHPVLAMVHDDRIGYVVPLQVDPDGSSRFTAEPVRARPQEPAPAEAASRTEVPGGPGKETPSAGTPGADAPRAEQPSSTGSPSPEPSPFGAPSPSASVPAPEGFGPPPVMAGSSSGSEPYAGQPQPGVQASAPADPAASPYAPQSRQAPADEPNPYLRPTAEPRPQEAAAGAAPRPQRQGPVYSSAPASTSAPTPPRGFDAIAEAVLDEAPVVPGPLAEPLARVNEAVRSGQVRQAAELAGRALAEGAGTLGADHPEVLRLRGLTAYIAYLAGDGERALRLSLELARVHRGRGDAEAAYGDVQSAATAWRAVRDPRLGLQLGHELIGLWTELAAEGGPAGDDLEELESAHTRMGRLTERAARQAGDRPRHP